MAGFSGLVVGTLSGIGLIYLGSDTLLVPRYVVLLFPVLLLWLSYRGPDARTWPVRPDGSPSTRARLAPWLVFVLIGLAGGWLGLMLYHVVHMAG